MRLAFAAAAFACTAACAQQPSGALFPDDATSVELQVTGGLAPTPGAGSTCTPADDSYTYVVATRALSWSACTSPTPGGAYTTQTGQATLASDAAQQLLDALRALALPPDPCGSDVTATMMVATAKGVASYPQAECLVGFSDVQDELAAAAQ